MILEWQYIHSNAFIKPKAHKTWPNDRKTAEKGCYHGNKPTDKMKDTGLSLHRTPWLHWCMNHLGETNIAYYFMYTCHQSNKFFTNAMSVFSDFNNVNWDFFICESEKLLKQKMKSGMLNMLLQPKLSSWNTSWAPDYRGKMASLLCWRKIII